MQLFAIDCSYSMIIKSKYSVSKSQYRSNWSRQKQRVIFMRLTGSTLWTRSSSSFDFTQNYEQSKFIRLHNIKILSFCHKLWFSNPYIFAIQSLRPKLFQSIIFFRSIQSSLKYLRITPSGYRNIVIRTFEFVAKTQFLSNNSNFSIIAQ